MPSFLAIDLGTSFIKGAVLDLDRLALNHVQRVPFPDPLPGLPPHHCEIAPGAVLAALRTLVDRLLPLAPDPAGLVMCSQMQGLVLTDAQGQALSNCITWRDQRALTAHPSGAGSYFDVLTQRLTTAQRRSLGELHAGLPVGALFTLAEQGRLPTGAVPASLPDWALAGLCEMNAAPGVEATNASVHGPLNLATLTWQTDVLAALRLDGLRWPQVRRAGDIVGHLRHGNKLLPCYAPVGDQPCSLAGALLQEGELSLNIATGSQVSRISPVLARGDYQTRPFFDGAYLNLITHIPAGRALNLLMALLTELAEAEGVTLTDPWGAAARAAAQVGPTDLQVNLAFFASLRGDRGAIANIREDNLSAGHLFRAAFHDMAENYFQCALRLCADGDGRRTTVDGAERSSVSGRRSALSAREDEARSWPRIVFSGGLAQKIAILRQVICERFGAEYRLCPSSEDALLGLLALALLCSSRAGTMAGAVNLVAGTWDVPSTCEVPGT